MRYKEIKFVKINPAENTTIFAVTPVEKEKRAKVANELMAYGNVQAEQVGFIELHPQEGIDGHVEMMGGEFCANASRSLGAYLAWLGEKPQPDGFYRITCSGCEQIMMCSVEGQEREPVMKAEIGIPLPHALDRVPLEVEGKEHVFYRVAFDGITHYVTFWDGLVSKDHCWQAVRKWADEDSYDALGLILFQKEKSQMRAAVYVKETDTLYWERSCGSGTAALGFVCSTLEKESVHIPVYQPGGCIEVMAYYDKNRVRHVLIGGPVAMAATGTAYIREE